MPQWSSILMLRKLNRILSTYAPTAIKGNRLTLGQVTDIINSMIRPMGETDE